MATVTKTEPWLPATSFPTLEQAHEAITILNATGIPVSVEIADRRLPSDDPPPGPNHGSIAVVVPAGRVREARGAIMGMRDRAV